MPRRTPYLIELFILVLLFASLAGCAATRQTLPPVAETMPLKKEIHVESQPLPAPEFNGSLYATSSSFNDFFVDTKARKIGDIVTVKISESSSATNSADTKTGRTSSLEAGLEIRRFRHGDP